MNTKRFIPCYILTSIIIISGLLVDSLRTPALILALLCLFITIVVFIKESKRLKGEIDEMIRFLEGISSGIPEHRPFIERGELKRLADSLIQLVDKLREDLSIAIDSKKNIDMILKNIKEGLIITDEKGTVILASDSIRSLLGIDTSLDKKPATEILRNAELILLLEKAKRSKESLTKEITLRDDRSLSVAASPVMINGKASGVIISFYDITRLKRLEQMRQDFVANVAHEIRTPITAIKGFAETLLEGALDDKENAIRFLEIVKRHSERLNSLVNDLLILSGIESGDIKLDIKEINLMEVIDQLLNLVDEKARKKGLQLRKVLPPQLPLIRADKDRLTQILLNLIDNAIKFTDIGSVTIGAELFQDKIILFVQDTGIGIEKRYLPRLGERFYRVDRARSRELGGTGLGLAIVKHLVRAHGWNMQIDSTPGKGTKVMIIVTKPDV